MCNNCLKKKAVVYVVISFAIPLNYSLHSTCPISFWQNSEMARGRKQASNQKSFLQRKLVPLPEYESTNKHMELQQQEAETSEKPIPKEVVLVSLTE